MGKGKEKLGRGGELALAAISSLRLLLVLLNLLDVCSFCRFHILFIYAFSHNEDIFLFHIMWNIKKKIRVW